jgi:hypothetical protein
MWTLVRVPRRARQMKIYKIFTVVKSQNTRVKSAVSSGCGMKLSPGSTADFWPAVNGVVTIRTA